jgi:cell division protein FtsL
MTPTALTPAGRGTRPEPRHGTAKRQPAAAGRATTAAQGARTVARSARAPVASGPAGGRGSGHRAPVRRPTAPRNPRRVSGPAPRRPSDQPVVRAPLAARSAAFIRALPDHALLDRIVRGRYWIPLLGVLLVGIVAMQVEVLKLNAGIGRALEQSTSLQNHNEQLRAAVARGADDQRIESIAAHMGMVMPQPAAIRFLAHDPITDVGKAISSIHAPDATSFQAALTAAGGATSSSASSTTSSVVTTPSTASSTSPGA